MFLYPHFGSFFLFYLCGGRCFYLVYLESLIRRLFLIYTPFFFFLIGKDNSLRAKRLERGYTQGIPRYKD